jgi:hypothetical protein
MKVESSIKVPSSGDYPVYETAHFAPSNFHALTSEQNHQKLVLSPVQHLPTRRSQTRSSVRSDARFEPCPFLPQHLVSIFPLQHSFDNFLLPILRFFIIVVNTRIVFSAYNISKTSVFHGLDAQFGEILSS